MSASAAGAPPVRGQALGGQALAGAPDPACFLARVTPVDARELSTQALDDLADHGVLVAGRVRLLAGRGVAATLPLERGLEDPTALRAVRAWLAAVECTVVTTGTGSRARWESGARQAPRVTALGAFPFDRTAPARLVVPTTTWCKDARGGTWRIDVGQRSDTARAREDAPGDAPWGVAGVPEGTPGNAAAGVDAAGVDTSIAQVPAPAGYSDAVARAVADIRAGRLRKVVLGRMVELLVPAPVAPSALLRALWGSEGPFSPFSLPTPAGRLVGASPELVIHRMGRDVVSHAFAGTVPLTPARDADAEQLADSAKDRTEHRLVVDEVVATLAPRCTTLTVPDVPTVVRLRSDARLGTLITGTLADLPGPHDRGDEGTDRADTVLTLLGLLHPTPAVGGVAREVALERIADLEPAPRGYWAGVAGWTDAGGDGEWVLSIRSVELDGRHAKVRAGAGIVADSEPERELAETTVKLKPVLEALWPGISSRL